MGVGVALMLLFALIMSRADPVHHDVWIWPGFLMVPLLLLAYGGTSVALWLYPPSRVPSIVVGVDCVLVRGRVIHYSKLQSVKHHGRYEEAVPGWSYGESGDAGEPPRDVWTVSLALVGGEVLDVATRSLARTGDLRTEDEPGAEIARAIEEARVGWVTGRADQDREVDGLLRGERTGSQWLETLRRLGSTSASASYRDVALDIARLSRLLDDRHAKPSARAAAALVLAASGDTAAAPKLRVAAEAMANPRLRIALENIAEGRDDAAVAEALEALEEEDCKRRA
jgi:hypothetical protein